MANRERDTRDADDLLRDRGHRAIVPSFDFRVDYCSGSVKGHGRDHNEDALLCRPDLGLFAIADGMGGHAAGEVAARESLDALQTRLSSADARDTLDQYAAHPNVENRRLVFELLSSAMRAANKSVMAASEANANRRGMGCTLDFCVLIRDRAFFAHVGDARAYLVRPTASLQLTHDHAAYDSLRTSGKRAPMAGATRSPLTNSIGHHKKLTVDTLFVDLTTNDRIVLCTDGAFSMFESEAAFGRVCRHGSATDVCLALVERARDRQGLDDASVAVVRVGERFATRKGDAGPRSRDLATIAASPLLMDMSMANVLKTMAAGVEVELEEGAEVPRAVANDRVAYVILDGLVELGNGRKLGPSGLLLVESLLDVATRGKLPKVLERTRLLRIRHDDFTEVCAHNVQLSAELHKRIARHLATTHR
jgi:serine/threonine protein phosphatase PrpC